MHWVAQRCVGALALLGQQPLPEQSEQNLVRMVGRAGDLRQIRNSRVESLFRPRDDGSRQSRPAGHARCRPNE